MGNHSMSVTPPLPDSRRAYFPFAPEFVTVTITTGDTATAGNICVFNITQNAEGDEPSFATGNNTADGSQRCYGIAMESGVAGGVIRVQVAGTCKANVIGKDSANATVAAGIQQLDYMWTRNLTGAGSEDQTLFKAKAGDRLFAQVCAGAANNVAADATGTVQIVILNPFNHVEL